MVRICLIFLLLHMSTLHAQDIGYAREIVNKLASDEFKGRGYVEDGHELAADFIAEEFAKNGVRPFKNDYFQKFTTPINTFPGAMNLLMDDQALQPGLDYLIEASSSGIEGEFEVIPLLISDVFNRGIMLDKLRKCEDKFFVVEAFDRAAYTEEQLTQLDDLFNYLRFHPDNIAAGTIFLTMNKLTWSASTVRYANPILTIKQDVWRRGTKKISIQINNKLAKFRTQNVLGFIEGKQQDSLVVFTAHYDHLGMMGSETIFPGANDNASGIAMLLNLTKYYQKNQPNYNTVFIAFGAEEVGLIGSRYFVEHPLFDLEKIKFLINFDIAGTGDEGIQVVNGSVYQKQFDRLNTINEQLNLLPQVKIRGAACNSDHCVFHNEGVPCFYMYTLGGIQAYHDTFDRASTLPLTEFEDYVRLIINFVDGL